MITTDTTLTISVAVLLIGAAFSIGVTYGTVRNVVREMKEIKREMTNIRQMFQQHLDKGCNLNKG